MNNTEKQLEIIYNLSTAEVESGSAVAFGIKNIGDNNYDTSLLHKSPDIYDMIEEIDLDKKQQNYDYLSFVTTGWAAPLNKDGEVEGMPSNHPERRRVTLVACVDVNEKKILGSVLKFDDQEDLIFDEGTATGMLADALLSLVK